MARSRALAHLFWSGSFHFPAEFLLSNDVFPLMFSLRQHRDPAPSLPFPLYIKTWITTEGCHVGNTTASSNRSIRRGRALGIQYAHGLPIERSPELEASNFR